MTIKGGHEGNQYLEYFLLGRIGGKKTFPSFAADTENASKALEIFLSRMQDGQKADARQLQRYENLCNGRSHYKSTQAPEPEILARIVLRDSANRDMTRRFSRGSIARNRANRFPRKLG